MAEYIERTPELILATNAGARAIENTKRFHGAIYTRDVFDPNKAEIAYLQAAKVLRDIEDIPAADVAPVVRCKDCKHRVYKYMNEEIGEIGGCGLFNRAMSNDDFCSYGERKENEDER